MSKENENDQNQQTEKSSQEQTQTTTSETTEENSTSQKEDSQAQNTEEQSSNPIADAVNHGEKEEGEKEPEGESDPESGGGDDENQSKDEDEKSQKESGEDDQKDGEDEGQEEYEITLSDDSPLSDEDLDYIAEQAEKNGWNKEQADNFVKHYEDVYSKGQQAANEPRLKYYKEQKENFDKDPDFNGDNKQKTYMRIAKAAKQFGGDDLIKDLSRPEIGNNYHLAKFLSKIGAMMEGDGPPIGKGGSGGEKDEYRESLRNLYPQYFKDQ